MRTHRRASMVYRLGILGMSLMVAGCWSKDYDEPGRIEVERQPTEVVLSADFARVWAATQAVLSKFPITKREAQITQSRGFVQTDWIRGKSDTLYHGFDRNRIPYVIRYRFLVTVSGEARINRMKVSVQNTEQYLDDMITAGVDAQGGIHSWIRTESSTLKENAILKQIEKLVLDPRFKVE